MDAFPVTALLLLAVLFALAGGALAKILVICFT